MAWIYLLVGGVFECAWAVSLKLSDGFSRPVPALVTVVTMLISLWMLSLAMKTLPAGTAYAVWTGIGAAGVALIGMFVFGESRELLRIFCIFLIVVGVVGLRLVSSGQP
ncbi:multidrug efflux SMR transporter [Prosthecochloris sp. HL-130-GSB]|uniref:Guanidinium exporter n=1 Tax=Prosthecochloris aestuarii TaxID=1102 RepID=A0A831SUE7_PROAE|nr:multidrug efflux SMR transporter [Prosthecochloris sp. HL-130-GSB]ARM31861.1 QacE family quaternary ammonium compound efflux SMR transporter [Prosthecochloris sp. HL-130-GSB]MBO8093337.1 multidrug efflux SMR transporter [Prosthecochloris sp.]HED31862.1 multidrug efflux SMR transporter [Prosthecochloris aestuarii]